MPATANRFEWTEFEGGISRLLQLSPRFSVTVMQCGQKAHCRILSPSNPILGERSEHEDADAAMRFAEARVIQLGGFAENEDEPRLKVVGRTN